MVAALAVIWIGSISAGRGLPHGAKPGTCPCRARSRHGYGHVLIIVSRNIDLSVGALLGFVGYVMAMAP